MTKGTLYHYNIAMQTVRTNMLCCGLQQCKCNYQNKKKLYGPFLWMGFNCLKATATSRRQFTFYHSAPRNSWCSFYRPPKDARLSRPWSHPGVLNTGPLDQESSASTTWPLLHIRRSSPLQLVTIHFFFFHYKLIIEGG